jgi:hypothetical protein
MIVKHVTQEPNKTGRTLILGKEYVVLSVDYYGREKTGLDYRILDEQGTPALYSYRLFEVVDPALPPEWQVSIYDGELFLIEPKAFFTSTRNGFWEDYYEGDSARQMEAYKVVDTEFKKIQAFHGLRNDGDSHI